IDIRAAWWSEWAQPSASNSSTSRYDKEKRRYQPTARRMTSGSNCLHLNRPESDDARSIGPAYQTTPAKLQHCRLSPRFATGISELITRRPAVLSVAPGLQFSFLLVER